ncbi:MAG: hypothetical protein HRT86_07970 [Ilumatobacteraceae bacterium]|nr:hypothetical protein [Ilumatobacteraceae bacterium]
MSHTRARPVWPGATTEPIDLPVRPASPRENGGATMSARSQQSADRRHADDR